VADRNVLVVATVPVDPERLRSEVRERAGSGARVRIVAPASDVSPLQWIASDEDDARAEAAEVASRAARAVEPDAAAVETEIGDPAPVQAIEDALRTFPAHELILVTPEGDEARWLEQDAAAFERFGLPVTHLAVSR